MKWVGYYIGPNISNDLEITNVVITQANKIEGSGHDKEAAKDYIIRGSIAKDENNLERCRFEFERVFKKSDGKLDEAGEILYF